MKKDKIKRGFHKSENSVTLNMTVLAGRSEGNNWILGEMTLFV